MKVLIAELLNVQLCNGSMRDFDSLCSGPNPLWTTKEIDYMLECFLTMEIMSFLMIGTGGSNPSLEKPFQAWLSWFKVIQAFFILNRKHYL